VMAPPEHPAPDSSPGSTSDYPVRTSGFAVASLIIAILLVPVFVLVYGPGMLVFWFIAQCLLVLGIPFGHIALVRIRRRGEGGHGLAVLGLTFCYLIGFIMHVLPLLNTYPDLWGVAILAGGIILGRRWQRRSDRLHAQLRERASQQGAEQGREQG
jgi:peptidoglycan/LPS O-acetylase OafA/YrhL